MGEQPDQNIQNLVVVIPAYRCARQITDVLRSIPPWITHIIVVDDASPDNLAEEVAGVPDTRIHYLRHQQNQGVGGAMLTGFNHALTLGADVIIKMDGDGQMDARYLPALVAPIVAGQADFAKGNRFLHLNDLVGQMPKLRLIGNFGLTFLTKLASGYWHIFDPNNSFIAIHREALALLNTNNIHPRYFFESSLLIELNKIRAVAVDVPMPARYRDEISSLSITRSLFDFPFNLMKGLVKRIFRQYFLYDFTAVSLFLILSFGLMLFGGLWGGYHWYLSIITDTPATTGTVMLAVLPVILGFQLLVQAVVLDIQNRPKSPIQQQRWLNSQYTQLVDIFKK